MVLFGHWTFRVTPTVAVVIGIVLVLLTASGCGTAYEQAKSETTLAPPLEETAGRGVSPSQPKADAGEGAAEVRAVAPDGSVAVAQAPAARQEVIWTIDEWVEPTLEPQAVEQTVVFEAPDDPAYGPVVVQATDDPASDPALDLPKTKLSETSVSPTPVEQERIDADTAKNDTHSDDLGLALDDTPATLDERPQLPPMFFVFGQVERPGPYKHTGRNRVFDIVAQVKPTKAADVSRVMLVRPSPNGKGKVFTIDTDVMVRQGDMRHNHTLEAGDILYIPPTFPAQIGRGIKAMLKPAEDDGWLPYDD